MSSPQRGSLTVVGTGIDVTTQLTPGARASITSADVVFYVLTDPVAALRVGELNPRARSLDSLYGPEKDRHETYEEIVTHVVDETLAGADVCLVAYGHPGVFAGPSHEAIARVRAAGLPARMLPAVSALDCLCADLGIDPGRQGLLVYEATAFLDLRPTIDPRATLVLFQVGMLGEPGAEPTGVVRERFPHLVRLLRERYGPERAAVLYEASAYPGVPPTLVHFSLDSEEPPVPSVLASLCIP